MSPGLRATLWAGLALPYAMLVSRFAFVCDDAWISFRFARHLALGEGLRYNLGAPAVEGYSNFLWVVIASAFEAAGADVRFWMPALSVACGLALLLWVFERLRETPGLDDVTAFCLSLTLALFPPFALWSTGGLATLPFALALFALFDELIWQRRPPRAARWAGLALAVSLLRVEGVLWVGVLTVLAWVIGRIDPRSRDDAAFEGRALWAGGALFFSAFALYTGWRFSYFGDWLPNTVRAKASLSPALLDRGFDYVAVYFLTFLTPFLLFPATVAAWRARGSSSWGRVFATASMAWAFPAYAIVTAGDFMAMGRFLVAGLPFATLLLGGWLGARLGGFETTPAPRRAARATALVVCVVGLLPAWGIHLVPESVRAQHHFRLSAHQFRSELDQWKNMQQNERVWSELGRALSDYAARELGPNPSLVRTAIGAVGYHSGLEIFDQAGLVSREVATRPRRPGVARSPGHDRQVGAWYFLEQQPTLLQADWIEGDDPAALAADARRRAKALRQGRPDLEAWTRYAPEVHLVDDDRGFVVWRRLAANSDWRAAWAEFAARLEEIESAGIDTGERR